MKEILLIRRPQVDDIDGMLKIEGSVFHEPWTKSMLLHEMFSPLSKGWVAECSNALSRSSLVGYVFFWMVAGEVHLTRLAVDSSWHGLGIGSQLLRAMLNSGILENAQQAILEVRSSNAVARKLYEKCGFIQIGVRPRYYENREDAIIMQCDFTENYLG
jgi:ribosomal-protein-alanine N-acetyltransferase